MNKLNFSMKMLVSFILLTFMIAMPLGAYEKIKDYLSITTGAVETRILNGSADPSASSGVAAPIGSEYLRNNGDSFKKVGSADTAWIRQLNTSTPVGLELFEDPSFEKGLPSYCVKGTYGSLSHAPSILKSPNNLKAVRVGVEMNETTTYTCSKAVGSEYTGLPIRHKGWVTLAPIGTFTCSITAQWDGVNVGNTQIITHGNNYYDLEVIPTGAGDTGFQISCVNPTSVFTGYFSLDETSNKAEKISPVLADVKRTQSETLLNVGNLTASTNLASFSVENDSGVRGIYTKSTTGLTFHQDADVDIKYSCRSDGSSRYELFATVMSGATLLYGSANGMTLATGTMNTSYPSAVIVGKISAGQRVEFGSNVTGGTLSNNVHCNVQISATATSPTIVMQNETFNSDINLGAWVAQPNTATCSSAVIEGEANIGKWTTCRRAASSPTKVGCDGSAGNLRPTQSDSGARANGIHSFNKPYNQASTCLEPSIYYVNIGKNLSPSTKVYKDTIKSAVDYGNFGYLGTTVYEGFARTYNPSTGVLWVMAHAENPTVNSSYIPMSDGTIPNNGYLVINASKNPAMSGVNLPKAAYVDAYNSSGQSIPDGYTPITITNWTKTTDTHNAFNAATGVFTAPEEGNYLFAGQLMFTGIPTATVSEISFLGDTMLSINLGTVRASGTQIVRLAKGQAFTLTGYQKSGAARNLSSTHCHIQISKIGF